MIYIIYTHIVYMNIVLHLKLLRSVMGSVLYVYVWVSARVFVTMLNICSVILLPSNNDGLYFLSTYIQSMFKDTYNFCSL